MARSEPRRPAPLTGRALTGAAWTEPADLLAKLRKRWDSGELLGAMSRQEPWEPLVVPLRAPTARELADQFGAAQDWVARWHKIDPKLVRLEYRTIGGRRVGSNQVPSRAVIEERQQLCVLLGVAGQVQTFTRLLDATRATAPALVDWMTDHPMKVLDQASRWSRLVETVIWIDRNARADRYLRQVDVPEVDTKFIEQHRGLLAALLDCQLAPERVAPDYPPARFAERYGFRVKPVYVRFRALGDLPSALGPYREMTLRVEELAATPLDVARVIVVENEVTYLALPPVPDSIAVLGGGYALSGLRPLRWLHDRELIYWGDIDTHGFAILDRLRQVFPHARSVLMDRETLLAHRVHWGSEPTPVRADLVHLRPDEAELYAELLAGTFGPALRLEQERVRFSTVEAALFAS
ncbi:Wadjet anti-phage system protein JetD domain-containing protein [Micromonospora sp. NPDC003197]